VLFINLEPRTQKDKKRKPHGVSLFAIEIVHDNIWISSRGSDFQGKEILGDIEWFFSFFGCLVGVQQGQGFSDLQIFFITVVMGGRAESPCCALVGMQGGISKQCLLC
jgi:hypothetical protein